MSKQLKQIGTVLFSNVVTQPVFNGTPTGKYEITLTFTEEQAADAETNGLSVTRTEYQGQTQIKAKLKTKYPLNSKNCVDRSRNPFVDDAGQIREIPRGSTVAVIYTTKPYTAFGGGVANYLQGLQVIEENSSIEFDDYDEPANLSDSGEELEF